MTISTITKNILLTPFNVLYRINPKIDLKLLFRLKQGYKLDLKNPRTFNEKIQWIKLYDRNPLMPKCVDKYTVRKYVEEKGCKEILNELLWQGYHPEDIPYDALPNKFVIKVTHGSTFNIICTDKSKLDKKKVIKKINKWLNMHFLPCYGEWFYGIEKPRIVVEKYLESKDGLKDYKVYCFNGEPKVIGVFSNRFGKQMYEEMYNCNWKEEEGKTSNCPNPPIKTKKPKKLHDIILYSKKLSEDFNHVRVDFYIEDETIIFGELTFTDGSGFDKFSSKAYDEKLGDYLILKNANGFGDIND